MSKVDGKFTNIILNDLQDVDLGGSQPANNTTIVYNDTTQKWEPKRTGQLVALKRVIDEDLLIEEDEFLIIKCPKITARLIVQGQLKVV